MPARKSLLLMGRSRSGITGLKAGLVGGRGVVTGVHPAAIRVRKVGYDSL